MLCEVTGIVLVRDGGTGSEQMDCREASVGRPRRPWGQSAMSLEGRGEARVQGPGPGVWVTIGAILSLETHTSLSRRAVKCGTDEVLSWRVLGPLGQQAWGLEGTLGTVGLMPRLKLWRRE